MTTKNLRDNLISDDSGRQLCISEENGNDISLLERGSIINSITSKDNTCLEKNVNARNQEIIARDSVISSNLNKRKREVIDTNDIPRKKKNFNLVPMNQKIINILKCRNRLKIFLMLKPP